MKSHSFDDIVNIDNALFQLASYDVTHGMIAVVRSQEEANDIQEQTIKRFNYFKRLIQRGSCTFDFIKDSVLTKNGPFKQQPINFDNLLKPELEVKEDKTERVINTLDSLLKNILLTKPVEPKRGRKSKH